LDVSAFANSVWFGNQACLEDDHVLVLEQLIEFTETEPAKLEKAASKRFF
jgi:hypothetical protein